MLLDSDNESDHSDDDVHLDAETAYESIRIVAPPNPPRKHSLARL